MKREQKKLKSHYKFRERLQSCQNSINAKNLTSALEEAKGLVNEILFCEERFSIADFQGIGNIENWIQQYPGGPF